MSAGSGPRPARAAPRSGYGGLWSCTARSTRVEAWESPRLATAPRPAGARPPQHRTTRPLPAPDLRSRRPGGRPERGEVPPLVARVERRAVVCCVGCLDLGRAVARQEGSERLIDERRIRQL